MRFFINVMLFLLVALLSSSVAGGENPSIKKLLETHGKEYVELRNAFLEREGEITIEEGDLRQALLADILAANKEYPEFFVEIDRAARESAARPNARPGHERPNIFMACAASRLMWQGVEEKEYKDSVVTKESAPYATQITYTQTDEEVAEIKRRNRAARLAVTEYLWKISEDWRITYELVDVFYFRHGPFTRRPIWKIQLLAFEDVFDAADHHLVLEVCANIFIDHKYDAILPLAREKLNFYRNDIDIGNYRNCLTLSRLLTELGDENDRKLVESIKPRLEELRKPYEEFAIKESQKRYREWEERHGQPDWRGTSKQDENQTPGIIILD